MTLPPEKIGDKGQRYVLRLKGYPKKGWQDVAYSDDCATLHNAAITKAPGVTDFTVIDRQAVTL